MKTRNKILIMLLGICLTVLSSTSCSPYTVAVGVAAKVNPDGAAAAVVTPVKGAVVRWSKRHRGRSWRRSRLRSPVFSSQPLLEKPG